MNIGIIGIGDIAKKAYLPLITRIKNLELHIFTRNTKVLDDISEQYRIKNIYSNLSELLDNRLDAVFLHSSTNSHAYIIEQCLINKIPVFVDKPISYDFNESSRLVDVSESKQCPMIVGFNRRFVPAYQKVNLVQQKDLIVMQKNRRNSSQNVRLVIYDDFIHVVDTLRYLVSDQVTNMMVHGNVKDNILHYVMLQLISKKTIAIGIMHRNTGLMEEQLDITSEDEKWSVRDLSEITHYKEVATSSTKNIWLSHLETLGFNQMIQDFLMIIKNYQEDPVPIFKSASSRLHNALISHQICEKIINDLLI